MSVLNSVKTDVMYDTVAFKVAVLDADGRPQPPYGVGTYAPVGTWNHAMNVRDGLGFHAYTTYTDAVAALQLHRKNAMAPWQPAEKDPKFVLLLVDLGDVHTVGTDNTFGEYNSRKVIIGLSMRILRWLEPRS